MQKDVITVAEAAQKLGVDKSSFLKRLKKLGYRIGKMRSDEARGQQVSVIRIVDFEELKAQNDTIDWK